MKEKYPLFDIYWDDKDIHSVVNIIKRGSYWAIGPEIQEFEEALGKYLGVEYIATFNSGTSALHAALLAYDITSGEVIVPSMSFISTANCVILSGAKPVFADIENESLGLDPEDVQKKINKNTKAIIPMHYGGRICKNIEVLKEIADDNDLILIEDNAESFGAKINNKFAGTIGQAGMLSFCQNKVITTGEGGAICTNDRNIYEKLLLIRSHGRVEQPGINFFSNINEMDYIQVGYNYRMPTMCAALGLSQLEKINKIIKIRRKIGKFYDKELEEVKNIQILPDIENVYNVYQLYSILLENPENRKELQEYLLERKIYTKIYFFPIHLKTYYKNKFSFNIGTLPVTEEVSKKVLSLPISLRFTEGDQLFIINSIKEFYSS